MERHKINHLKIFMDTQTKEVETKVETASTQQQEVETKDSGASAEQKTEINLQTDLEKALAEKDAELAKIAQERDNYKLGLLKAKGKILEEEPLEKSELTVAELVAQEVKNQLFSTKENQLQAEKDSILQQALKENKELKVALQNKQGISTAPSGSSSDNSTASSNYFSSEQITELKARGFDDKKIQRLQENMKKFK